MKFIKAVNGKTILVDNNDVGVGITNSANQIRL
jgi:hypothetical protein